MPVDKLTIEQFAQKIKAKYPEYRDIDDSLLTEKIVAKYPQYKDMIQVAAPQQVSQVQQQPQQPQLAGFQNAKKPSGTISNEQVLRGQQQLQAAKNKTVEQTQAAQHGGKQHEEMTKQMNVAAENTVNKMFGKSLPSNVDQVKENLLKGVENGSLGISTDANTGENVIRNKGNFFQSFKAASDQAYAQNIENKYLRSIGKNEAIQYLNRIREHPETGVKDMDIAPNEAGKMVGEQAGMIGKTIIGGMALAETGLTGGASAGGFLAIADDLASAGYSQALKKNYDELKKEGLSDSEAFDKATHAALTGEAVSLAQGALLSGEINLLPKLKNPATIKGFTKSLEHTVKTAPKVVGSAGVGSVINDIQTNAIANGTPIDTKKMWENAEESMKPMFIIHGSLGVLGAIANGQKTIVPSFSRPQAENVVASLDRNEVKNYYEQKEASGEFPQGTTQKVLDKLNEFDVQKEVVKNMPISEEKKAAITGKLIQRKDLVEQTGELKKYGSAFNDKVTENEKQISAIDKDINDIYSSEDFLKHERDAITGEKATDQIKEKAEVPSTETDKGVTSVAKGEETNRTVDEEVIKTDKGGMTGGLMDEVEVDNEKVKLPEKGFVISDINLNEGVEKGKGAGQEIYRKALDKYGVLYSSHPISESALNAQNALKRKGLVKIENIKLEDGTELRKITKIQEKGTPTPTVNEPTGEQTDKGQQTKEAVGEVVQPKQEEVGQIPTEEEFKRQNPHSGGVAFGKPVGDADAFNKLPDESEVWVFHATTPENAKSISEGRSDKIELQGQGIKGRSDLMYVGSDPKMVAKYGKTIVAIKVRKGDIEKSPEAARKETVGDALIDYGVGAVLKGKPIEAKIVENQTKFGESEKMAYESIYGELKQEEKIEPDKIEPTIQGGKGEAKVENVKKAVNLPSDEGQAQNIVSKENKGAEDNSRSLSEKSIKEKLSKLDEIVDPYDRVMQYFANDGKIHTSSINELFGGKDKRIRIKTSTEGERRARINIIGKDAPSIDALAHKLFESDQTGKYETTDYREAIENVLLEFNSKHEMAKDLVKRYDTETAYQEYLNKKHGQEAIDIVEQLSEDDMNHILEMDADEARHKELEDYIDNLHEPTNTENQKELNTIEDSRQSIEDGLKDFTENNKEFIKAQSDASAASRKIDKLHDERLKLIKQDRDTAEIDSQIKETKQQQKESETKATRLLGAEHDKLKTKYHNEKVARDISNLEKERDAKVQEASEGLSKEHFDFNYVDDKIANDIISKKGGKVKVTRNKKTGKQIREKVDLTERDNQNKIKSRVNRIKKAIECING